MTLDNIKLMFEYNCWANQLLLSKAENVQPARWMGQLAFSWGSLAGTMVHIFASEYLWRSILQHGVVLNDTIPPTDFPTPASLRPRWEAEMNDWWAYLDTLTDADLSGTIRYEIEGGIIRERILWHCIYHVINHGTQHRSESAVMLTNLAQSPGDIDMTVFLNQR